MDWSWLPHDWIGRLVLCLPVLLLWGMWEVEAFVIRRRKRMAERNGLRSLHERGEGDGL